MGDCGLDRRGKQIPRTMIYDHIRNISLYKGLSDALDMALDFIASAVLPMDNGTTLLPHGVKAIASEYETKPTNPKGYEAHIKYADVQFLLAGSESIRCCPIEFLEPVGEYDEAGDCRFYSDPSVISSASAATPSVISSAGAAGVEKSLSLRLGAGYFAVLFPDDGHMPGLAVREPGVVKKVVVKVPVG